LLPRAARVARRFVIRCDWWGAGSLAAKAPWQWDHQELATPAPQLLEKLGPDSLVGDHTGQVAEGPYPAVGGEWGPSWSRKASARRNRGQHGRLPRDWGIGEDGRGRGEPQGNGAMLLLVKSEATPRVGHLLSIWVRRRARGDARKRDRPPSLAVGRLAQSRTAGRDHGLELPSRPRPSTGRRSIRGCSASETM
jgi:hypothetical protein